MDWLPGESPGDSNETWSTNEWPKDIDIWCISLLLKVHERSMCVLSVLYIYIIYIMYTLLYIALYSITLHCIILYCIVLYCITWYYIVLYYFILFCITWYYIILYYIIDYCICIYYVYIMCILCVYYVYSIYIYTHYVCNSLRKYFINTLCLGDNDQEGTRNYHHLSRFSWFSSWCFLVESSVCHQKPSGFWSIATGCELETMAQQ